ncbi:hypothetical protein EA472_10530 [Natrarchaeobius oligotrophus]|uniref:Uncharacterized protein n=1 Tax=Natrarchaeobius chitinivorans TaxID=1679083 RepID=A0A3N6NLR8_NATCH|nr:hypothetical protein EA472_10530 [Natrarchaeobius chitinivorans]
MAGSPGRVGSSLFPRAGRPTVRLVSYDAESGRLEPGPMLPFVEPFCRADDELHDVELGSRYQLTSDNPHPQIDTHRTVDR